MKKVKRERVLIKPRRFGKSEDMFNILVGKRGLFFPFTMFKNKLNITQIDI